MKKLLPVFLLLFSCSKDSSFQSSSSKILSNSTFISNGSLDLQTTNADIASLGIVNYRSSYELCGTSGNNLLWPVALPLYDSAVYPSSILADGDSLSAEVYVDTVFKKAYNITLKVSENNILINNQSVFSKWSLARNFAFHSGSKYQITATVQ